MSHSAKFAVAIMVLRQNHEGSWECVQVARKDNHDQWSLPGGKVDQNETSPEAAHRELREETEIDLGSAILPAGRIAVGPLFTEARDTQRLIPQETLLDSGGYFTTFYLLDTTGMELPDEFTVAEHEAPARWGPISALLTGPYATENEARFRKLGVLK